MSACLVANYSKMVIVCAKERIKRKIPVELLHRMLIRLTVLIMQTLFNKNMILITTIIILTFNVITAILLETIL